MSVFAKKHFSRRLSIQSLEDRRMLATINWINDDPLTNDFNDLFQENAPLATALVNRAIDDWEQVIESFNYAADNDAEPNNDLNDTFMLKLTATTIPFGVTTSVDETSDDKPQSGTIILGADAGGNRWYSNATPSDDAEFSKLDLRHSSLLY